MKHFLDYRVVQNVVHMCFAKFEVLNLLALGDLQEVPSTLFEECKNLVRRLDLLVEIFETDHINYVGTEFLPL